MDDMDRAFDDQLERVLESAAGPSRPVDVTTVVQIATAAPAGRWTAGTRWLRDRFGTDETGRVPSLSSMARFVAAAAIVTLFGGFLLSGLLTAPPREDPSSGIPASPSAGSAVCPPGSKPDRPGPEDQARPMMESYPSIAFDRGSGQIVTIAPDVTDGTMHTWAFDVCANTWSRLGPVDESSWRGPLVYDAGSDLVIGLGDPGTAWAYDLETDTWQRMGPIPDGRRGLLSGTTRLVYDPDSDRVFIPELQQMDAAGPLSTLWAYDVDADSWDSVVMSGDVPLAGEDLLLAYDTATRHIVACDAERGGTWLFDPPSGTWQVAAVGCQVDTAYNAWGGEIAYDAAAGRTVVFSRGRLVAYDADADAWEVLYESPFLDGLPVGPHAGLRHRMVYDPINERIVVMGGAVGDLESGGVWAFDTRARAWIELLAPAVRCVAGDLEPSPPLDSGLIPGADRFVLEEVGPGVRRLVHDGAGHYPSAPDVRNPPDLDVLAVSEYGSLMLWTSTHGMDTRRDGDRQLWILGQEGVLSGLEEYPDLGDQPAIGPDGSVWSDSPFGGVRRFDGEACLRFLADYEIGDIAVTGDGRAWVVASDGEDGGLYVIEGEQVADE